MDLATYTKAEGVGATGAARAAILLLALGPSGASRLLKHLSPDEIRSLRRGAAFQPPVTAFELDQLVSDFQDAFRAGPGLMGLDGELNKLLTSSLSAEELQRIFEGEAMPGGPAPISVWLELEQLKAASLQTLLQREHPQVIAFILSRLDSDISAAVVIGFAPRLRNEVMRRMLSAKPLSDELSALIEGRIRDVFVSASDSAGRSARHQALAEIVNRMEKSQSDDLLASIEEVQPEEAAALRSLLFAFDDLVDLPKKSRLLLFDTVPTESVILALQGVGDTMKEVVLSSLAARARRMVEAELSQGSAANPKDVAAARRAIAQTALRMAAEGTIALSEQPGD